MKRVFGTVEAIFDISYLLIALFLSSMLVLNASGNSAQMLAGIMGYILVSGDAFHLFPRILVIITGKDEKFRKTLGTGKQITSISMTVFYILLWHIGVFAFSPKNIMNWTYLIYALAAVRIFLCLMPQNKWRERHPPVTWGMIRNIPFFLQGIFVAGLFYMYRDVSVGLGWMWVAIALSFAFYLPVVLWANTNPKIGMLMLPKSCAYLWILAICLSL